MSQPTLQTAPQNPTPLEIVQDVYAAVAAGDFDRVLKRISQDFYVVQSTVLPFAGRWEGQDGFRAMGAAIYAAWPDFSVTPERFLVDGDTVLVLTRVRGACASARPLDQPMIEKWRVLGRHAVECQPFYFDPTAAASSAHQGD